MQLRLILLLYAVTSASAQTFAVVPKVSVGQQFKIEITKTREDARPGRGNQGRSDVFLKFIEANEKGSVADWAVGKSVLLTDVPASQRALFDAMSKSVEGIHLELQFDAEGAFTDLRNADEVAGQLTKMTALVIEEITKAIPDSQRDAFVGQMTRILTPSALIASATKEVQLLFNLSGAELKIGERSTTNLESPNPFGGEGILPSVFEVSLEKLTGTEAHVSTVQKHDGKALVAMFAKLMSNLPQGEMPQLEAIDTGEFVFDAATKLPKRVHHVAKFRVDHSLARIQRISL